MRRRVAVGLGLVLGAAAMLFALRGPLPTVDPTASAPRPPFEPATPLPVRPAAARFPPLPPQQGPLRERVADLRQRAEQGDGVAACHLVLELAHCRSAANRGGLSRLMEGVASRYELGAANDEVLTTIASAREAEAASAEHCAGLDDDAALDGVVWLQRAAAHGNTRLRVVAALVQPDGQLLRLPRGAAGILPIDNWVSSMASQFYADHALDFLRDGYAAHDPLALEGLILIHAPDSLQLPVGTDVAFRLPDPRRFAGFALLAERIYGSDSLGSQVRNLLQRVLERMEDGERARLEHEVEREAARWLADRERPPALPDSSEGDAVTVICQ